MLWDVPLGVVVSVNDRTQAGCNLDDGVKQENSNEKPLASVCADNRRADHHVVPRYGRCLARGRVLNLPGW